MIPAIVTTFPRNPPTLPKTLASLDSAGFSSLQTHPGTGHPRHDWQTASAALLASTDAPLMLVAQDDILICRGLAGRLERLAWPQNVGCLSLYAPDRYAEIARAPGFRVTGNTWGACALLFPRAVLQAIIESPVYREWPTDRQIDSAVGAAVEALGLEFWYLWPSAVQHVGDKSTLCEFSAAGWRQASSFVGEETDGGGLWNGLWE